MGKTSNLSIRIDPDLKKQADELFANFGMNVSEAVNIFLHQSLIQGGLPFKVKLQKKSVPNAETLAAMKESMRLASDPNAKQYSSFKEILKELEADV